MLSQIALNNSCKTSRDTVPEHHERLRKTAASSEALVDRAPLINPIDVELLALVVNVAEDALRILFNAHEIGREDVEAARDVMVSVLVAKAHADTSACTHLDTLIERADALDGLLLQIQIGV